MFLFRKKKRASLDKLIWMSDIYLHFSKRIKSMTASSFFPGLLCAAILLFAHPAVLTAQQTEVQAEETQVTVKRFSGVEISGATEICEGSETALKVDGEFESYSWSTGEMGRTIKVSKAGVYEVTVKTKGGCSFTTSVNVRVKPCT